MHNIHLVIFFSLFLCEIGTLLYIRHFSHRGRKLGNLEPHTKLHFLEIVQNATQKGPSDCVHAGTRIVLIVLERRKNITAQRSDVELTFQSLNFITQSESCSMCVSKAKYIWPKEEDFLIFWLFSLYLFFQIKSIFSFAIRIFMLDWSSFTAIALETLTRKSITMILFCTLSGWLLLQNRLI